ncbi:hypothetical protein SLEP1_g23226 [Rubroshorea leprosula]|uniref:Mechanosensitive ion channel MscS domain-containing protein n=1 Tax=Rubroshorea leprosula TaxID=152421 RepID=A0AAV5JGZ8_9ROSI|nr:hypothetical protein SLEP1_g23226 [Rubroshorea leprosula]
MPEGCSSISNRTKSKWLIEGIVFVLSLGGLIASLTGNVSKNHAIWFLEPWKWCVLVMVIVGGRRIMQWMMMLVVYSVKTVFLFMEVKVYYSYYIYSLGKCIGVVLWFGSVLLTWVLLFKSSEVKRFLNLANHEVKRSKLDSHVQKYITRSLGTLVIGGFLWVLKALLVNILSSPFQATRLFHRFRESLIDQYILGVFSRVSDEKSVVVKWINKNQLPCKKKGTNPVINRLKKIEPEEISAWSMNHLMSVITSPDDPLSPITQKLEKLAKKEQDVIELFEKTEDLAADIFKNVSEIIYKDESILSAKKIEKGELQQLPLFEAEDPSDDVKYVLQHILGGQNDEIIGIQALKKWLVNAIIERRSLAQSLNDTAIAIDELNKLLSVILLILLFVLWLIMLGILTTEAFIAIMGQFVALAFIFGDTVKSTFQGIIFVFVNHPFDIGDSCLINGEEMVVEKINLHSTVFRKNHVKDKVMCPNSVLATQRIKKLYKGDRHVIEDSFEIAIALSTIKVTPTFSDGLTTTKGTFWATEGDSTTTKGAECDSTTTTDSKLSQIEFFEDPIGQLPQIKSLRTAIDRFLRVNKNKWLPNYSFNVKEIEDQKLKIVLRVSYRKTDLDSDWAMIIERRNALVIGLTTFIAVIKNIKSYNILPKAVDADSC